MKTLLNKHVSLVILIFLSLSFSVVQAQMVKVEMEEISVNSHSIIKGVVSKKWSEYDTNGKDIITIVEFNISETIKGPSSEIQRVVIPGGVVGNVGMMVSHTPKFHLGEQVIVFITNDYKGRPTVTEWIQGKFEIINNNIFYEGNEIPTDSFILGLKNFISNGEQGKIEIYSESQNNGPNSPEAVPSISSITPSIGSALRPYAINPDDPFNPGERGTIVDIYGSNFGSTQGTSVVRFYESGSVPVNAQYILQWSDFHIKCKIPGRQWNGDFLHASSGSVYVITSGGTSNGVQFNVRFATPNKKFSNPNITFDVNQNGTPDCEGEFTAIQNSLQTWSSVDHSTLSFVYGGTTTRMPSGNDGHNDIGWIESNWPYASSAIGVNTYYFNSIESSNELFESDIRFNGVNFTWTTTGQTGRMDVQNITTHELGHALNLHDLYGNTDGDKTMYGYSSTNETKKRTLDTNDELGCAYLYPESFSLTLKNNFEFDSENNGYLTVTNLTQSTNAITYNSPLSRTVYWGNTFQVGVYNQINVNGREYNFAGWSDNLSPNPRMISPNDNQTYKALYKMPNHSNEDNAYSNSSQRKFIRDLNGNLHKVYSSMGRIWYEKSTNNGVLWTIQNDGRPLSTNESKLPSMDHYNGQIIIVWQEEYLGSYKIRMAHPHYISGELVFNDVFDETQYNPTDPEPYSFDAMPVIAWENYALVVWKEPWALHYRYGEIIFSSPEWYDFNWIGATVNKNASSPTLADDNDNQYFPVYHLAWQEGTSSIKYCSLTQDYYSNVINISSILTPSANCGYTQYYSPSILVMETDGIARLCWVGYRYVCPSPAPDIDCIGYPQYKVIFRGLNNFTRHWEFGNNVSSPNINRKDLNYTNPYYAFAWYETQGQNKFADNTLSTVRTLNTVGQHVQISNGQDKNSMYGMSFDYSSSPYYFQTSNNLGSFYSLGKEQSNAFASGREGVVSVDSASFYFAFGDVIVDGQPLDFVEIADTVQINNLSVLNENLVTEPIEVSDNCSFVYSVQYGINDSLSAVSALIENRYVNFKVQLVDANTGEIIGEYDNVTYNSENVYEYGNVSYQVNTQGIGNRIVRLKLIVENNFASNLSLAKIYADEYVLGKANVKQINYNENKPVTSYALAQNYPNPFNPSTTIKFEIPKNGLVTLKIYDILGSEVVTLVNEEKSVGRYELNFNASSLASGVYIYKIQVNDFISSKKMILLK